MFVDLSLLFSTIIPEILPNLATMPVCQGITNFQTNRKQLVRLDEITLSTLTISTGIKMVISLMRDSLEIAGGFNSGPLVWSVQPVA